jgi:cell division protein ZipA
MDLTIRDWMVIVGVVLIFAVLVDAWRRVRSERYSRVKLNVSESSGVDEGADEAEAFNWHKELPNGGARVVERSDLLRQASAAASREAVEAPAGPLKPGLADRQSLGGNPGIDPDFPRWESGGPTVLAPPEEDACGTRNRPE